jgi:mgtE-like transporter
MGLRRDFREMLSAELISVTGGLFAGFLLAFATNKFELVPGLFILLPGFLEMRGNISGTLSGRLSSGLFVGALKPRFSRKNKILKGNIIASIVLVMVVSLTLGIVAFFGSAFIFHVSNVSIIFVALIAGVLSNVIEIPLTIATTFWLFRHGHDPNNIMGPYVTTTGDITSVVSLLIAVIII